MRTFFILLIFSSITSFGQQEKNLKLYDIVDYSDTLSWTSQNSGYGLIDSSFQIVIPQNEVWIISAATIDIQGDLPSNTEFEYLYNTCPGLCLDGKQIVNWQNQATFIDGSNGKGFLPLGTSASNGFENPCMRFDNFLRDKILSGQHTFSMSFRHQNWNPLIQFRIVVEKYKFD